MEEKRAVVKSLLLLKVDERQILKATKLLDEETEEIKESIE